MVGRKDNGHGITIPFFDMSRCKGDTERCIAAGGFNDDIVTTKAARRVRKQCPAQFAGNDENILFTHQSGYASDCFGHHRAIIKQVNKLFWYFFSGKGPQFFTYPTRHDNGIHMSA